MSPFQGLHMLNCNYMCFVRINDITLCALTCQLTQCKSVWKLKKRACCSINDNKHRLYKVTESVTKYTELWYFMTYTHIADFVNRWSIQLCKDKCMVPNSLAWRVCVVNHAWYVLAVHITRRRRWCTTRFGWPIGEG